MVSACGCDSIGKVSCCSVFGRRNKIHIGTEPAKTRTPNKNTDSCIPQKEFPTEMHGAIQSEMISKYFLVFHQNETSSVFPQCSHISIKIFKILRFPVHTCGKHGHEATPACGKPFGNCWKCRVFAHFFSTFPTECVVENPSNEISLRRIPDAGASFYAVLFSTGDRSAAGLFHFRKFFNEFIELLLRGFLNGCGF